MDRRDCLKRFTEMGVCAGALSLLGFDVGWLPGATTPVAALGRPFQVEVLESVRRGSATCHFLVRV